MISNLETRGQNPRKSKSKDEGLVCNLKMMFETERGGAERVAGLVDGARAKKNPAEAQNLKTNVKKKTDDSKDAKFNGMGAKSFWGKGQEYRVKTTYQPGEGNQN